jgi:hypothetical protein
MRSRPRVKICCIKSPEEAAQAVACGVETGFLAGFSYRLQSLIHSIATMVFLVSRFTLLGRV